MLGIFRTNQYFIHLLVLLYLGVLWLPAALTNQAPAPVGGGFVVQWLWSILPNSPWFLLIVALLLVWLQGWVLNYLTLEYRMGPQATLYAGLCLAWFYSSTPEMVHFSAPLVGNTFLVFAIHQAYSLYRHAQPAKALFNMGFLISMASLSYFPFIFLVPGAWFIMGVMRGHRLNESLQYAVGAIMPWFLLFLLFYWTGPLVSFQDLVGINLGWPIRFMGPSGLRIVIQMCLFLFLFFFLISRARFVGLGETIQVQKNLSLAYFLMLGGGFSLVLTQDIYFHHMLVMALPFALIAGIWLSRISNRLAETIHFLLLCAVLLYQYFPLL